MPNRIIKESICTSEEIDRLSAFQEIFFYRLIVNCDDYGRMDARPKILASKLFPLKDIRANQIEDALRALTSAELVILYTVDGKPFLQMKTWDKHQRIRNVSGKYPAPEEGMISNNADCGQLTADCGQLTADCGQLTADCGQNPIQKESESESKTKTERSRLDEAFNRFWAAYPRKEDKQKAKKAFERLKPDEGLLQTMLAGIERQKKSAQWTKDGGQFIPHPTTWLNGCRWEDEMPKSVPKWANDAAHGYTQREYTEEQLLAVSDDLIEEARKYRGKVD